MKKSLEENEKVIRCRFGF